MDSAGTIIPTSEVWFFIFEISGVYFKHFSTPIFQLFARSRFDLFFSYHYSFSSFTKNKKCDSNKHFDCRSHYCHRRFRFIPWLKISLTKKSNLFRAKEGFFLETFEASKSSKLCMTKNRKN